MNNNYLFAGIGFIVAGFCLIGCDQPLIPFILFVNGGCLFAKWKWLE